MRSHDQFQGARYELAVAALMVRSGFVIKWKHGTDRHCEFEATCNSTGETIAVEVKSRHVSGTLNQLGTPPNPDCMRFLVHRYYNEAIKQCPTDKPCAMFINLNLPPQVNPGSHYIPWWSEMQKLIDALPRCSAEEPTPETSLVLTNFVGHYSGSDEAPGSRYIFVFPQYVRHPLKNPDTLTRLLQAMETYGQIPEIE